MNPLAFVIFVATVIAPISAIAGPPVESQAPDADAGAAAQAALDRIATYAYGDGREALSTLRVLVQSSLDSADQRRAIEERMIAFLASDADFAGKQFVGEQLGIIGTERTVPVLAQMLTDPTTTDIALYALQRIPGPEADRALRDSLAMISAAAGIEIINSIGERRDAAAVPALEALVYGADPRAAHAAVSALGKIADDAATLVLAEARWGTTGDLRELVLDAYLRCADRIHAAGVDAAGALAIYRDIYDNEDATNVRAAALRGLVRTDQDQAVATVLRALRRDNRALQAIAAGLVRELPDTAELGSIIAEIAALSPPTQVQVLSSLAGRGERAAYPAVIDALHHYDEEVRVAAISALVTIGDESDIALLTDLAAAGLSAADQEAARRSLGFLPGTSVDRAIIARVPEVEPALRAELVRALGERAATEATGLLLETSTDPDPAVRRESLRSLAIISGPDQLTDVIDLLIAAPDAATRDEAARTVVLVSRKITGPAGQAAPVLAVLPGLDDGDAKSSLIEALGRIGDPTALPAIRVELQGDSAESRRAAIAALSTWPDDGPAPDLLNVAETSDEPIDATLALRGYIGLLRQRGNRSPAETVDLFVGAMALATEPAEKSMILAGLGALRSPLALTAAARYLGEPGIERETDAALLSILRRIRGADDERIRFLLDDGLRGSLTRIVEEASDPELREMATQVLARG